MDIKNNIDKTTINVGVTQDTYQHLLNDTQRIIEDARNRACQSVNVLLVERNWNIGRRISEEKMNGGARAAYGAQVIQKLSEDLTQLYGKGFTKSNLYSYISFYHCYKEIFHAVSGKSPIKLSWTHYRTLLQVTDEKARNWYTQEAEQQIWSVRTLQRNISSQYYYRLLQSQRKELVEQEMLQNTKSLQGDQLDFIKNPVVAEFLGFAPNADFTESDLEHSIITNMEHFLLEMGKGFAFVARQQHIHTEKEDYYIDLVFYNYILKCFVLIDLKSQKVTHQDVGQMDMYVRMYDELKRTEGDNPTLGIILCADTDDDIARYSVLHDNDHLFASKYLTYLPTKEQLRDEIERQKQLFYLQQAENKKD